MSADERDERPGDEDEEEQEDVGVVGGGGPGATLPEYTDPDEEDVHRPDTGHGEL